MTINEYIAAQPKTVQPVLKNIRKAIHQVVPGAQESISYGIPTITLNGRYIIYFAAWKHHISIYPIPKGDDLLQKDITPYKKARGTLKFALDQPLPYDLIKRVAHMLATERQKKLIG